MLKFCVFPLQVLFFINFCEAMKMVTSFDSSKASNIIPELYNIYKEVVDKDENVMIRRLFKDNKQYLIHIKKLKDVNGIKTHNLIVTDDNNKTTDPMIYINNPVESHLPYAYLTKEQFKKDLLKDVKKQREDFQNQKLKQYLNDILKVKHVIVHKQTELNTTPKKNASHKKHKIYTTTEKTSENIDTTTENTSEKIDITTEKTGEKIDITTENTSEKIDITTEKTSENIDITTEKTSENTITPSTENVTISTYTTEMPASKDISTTSEPTEGTSAITTQSTTVSEVTELPTTTTVTPETVPTTELTTVEITTTLSTRKTRGRPYVFMGDGFKNMG